MNTNIPQRLTRWIRRVSGLVTVMALLLSNAGSAYALSFLYQDDIFHEIPSEGLLINSDDGGDEDATLQFGNDGTDASIVYDDGADFLTVDTLTRFSDAEDSELIRLTDTTNADSTGVYTGTGSPDTALSAEAGSIFLDQSGALYVNTDGATAWTNVAATGGLDNLDDVYNNGPVIATLDTSDTGYNITSTDGDGFNFQNSGTDFATFSVDGSDNSLIDFDPFSFLVDATDSISFDAADPSNFTVASDGAGDDLTLSVTGATDSSVVISSTGTGTDAINIDTTAGDIDIDATGDNAITIDATEASNLSVATDAAAEDLTIAVTGATDSSVVISSSGTGADAVDINATAGGVTIDASDDEGVSVDGTDASNFTVATDAAGEDLTLSVTGATDSSVIIDSTGTGADAVRLNASAGGFDIDGTTDSTINTTTGDITIGAGDDLFFDDAQLTGTVQLSVADTDWDADFAGDGVIDNINDITTQLGGDSISTFNFTEANVLADDDTVYAALEKLDLQWGDLASTATGEGASLVGVEDSAGNFTATNVETVLAEIAGQIGPNADNVEDLTFYPEYPDAVIFADGSTNRGRLVSDYDDTNDEHFYNWTSRNGTTQDIDIKFRFPLPPDFTDVDDFTYRFRTGSAVEADNDIEIGVYNATDETLGDPTLCGEDTTNVSAATWATGTIAEATLETGCTGGTALDAGDIIEVQVKLFDNSGGADFADVGFLRLGYEN